MMVNQMHQIDRRFMNVYNKCTRFPKGKALHNQASYLSKLKVIQSKAAVVDEIIILPSHGFAPNHLPLIFS